MIAAENVIHQRWGMARVKISHKDTEAAALLEISGACWRMKSNAVSKSRKNELRPSCVLFFARMSPTLAGHRTFGRIG